MLYLVLKRDLEKLSLARKHVLSDNELLEASVAIEWIISVTINRLTDLNGGSEEPDFPTSRLTRVLGIFKQQNLEAKDQFEIFANGLVCAFSFAIPRDADFTGSAKYNTASAPGALLEDYELRGPSNPIPYRGEIIPASDSIPLSILHYPTEERYTINFSAYDPPELTLLPAESAHPMFVPCLYSPLGILTKKIDLGYTMESYMGRNPPNTQ